MTTASPKRMRPAGAARLTNSQELDLNDEIIENEASAVLIRAWYGLAIGERLLVEDMDDCVERLRAGQFSGVAK